MTTVGTDQKTVLSETELQRIAEGVFVPLAKLLADHGVTCPQAERLLRAVCVRQAAVTEAETRKKPNFSRVALLTGLDRKEVARLLTRPRLIEVRLETNSHPGYRVLQGWYSDRTFSAKGRPLALSIKAPQRSLPTFWSLANRYAPGVYPGLILRELLRIDAIESLRDGRVRPRARRAMRRERNPKPALELKAYIGDILRPLRPEACGRKLKTRGLPRKR